MAAATLGCPMLFTGHSLGRNKLDNVLRSGRMTRAEAESVYKISRRRATIRIPTAFSLTDRRSSAQMMNHHVLPYSLAKRRLTTCVEQN